MATKIKISSIPSLKVNVNFLKELGDIIEINNGKRQDKSIKYTINSPNETINFNSIKELVKTNLLPSKIESISCRIYGYPQALNKIVDVHINLDNIYLGTSKFELSSENEEKLLLIESQLKKLFGKYETNYSFLHKYFLNNFGTTAITMSVVIILIGIPSIRLISFLLSLLNIKLDTQVKIWSLYLMFVILNYPGKQIFTIVFPRYLFEISGRNEKRKLLIGIFTTLMLAAIYDFLKSLLPILFKK